jgi:eukaryotic-like serine/threonine-protein kinase
MIAVGQTIGNYTITAKLGEGGMGVVYLAEHPVIGRKVAMKAIHPELSRNPEVVSRFITEAKSVNQIGNEHIVDINDFGTTSDGEFYFVMEFLQGEALADQLKRAAPFAAARALAIAAQVADALGASHQHGIIHRDLKPENIFLINRGHSADFVKVLDFGLAKLTQGDEKITHKTRTGSVMGTPYYMSPEQCEGKANIDHRADIYSLGVILFEMVTAKVPFGGEGYGEIIVKHITAPVPSPRAINPLLPPSLEAIILRALAKPREQRFQTMEEFAEALLDPERYASAVPQFAATQPIPHAPTLMSAGATPDGRADSVVSGRVIFGHGSGETNLGAASAPMPSTFRHAKGEIVEDDDLYRTSKPRRTGKIVALLAVVAATAGAAAYYLAPQPGSEQKEATAVVSPAPPPTPKKIRLALKSDPAGAAVLRKDTNEQIGITPFDVELAAGKTPIEFLFKRDAFRDKTESFVPEESGQLAVALVASPPAEKPPVVPTEVAPTAKSAAKSLTKSAARPAPVPRRKPGPARHGSRSMDEDGVLAPSF